MQEIPENMLRNIDKENILFRSEVEKVISDQKIQLKDGQVFEPKKIIFTGTSQYLMNKKIVKLNKNLFLLHRLVMKYVNEINIKIKIIKFMILFSLENLKIKQIILKTTQ